MQPDAQRKRDSAQPKARAQPVRDVREYFDWVAGLHIEEEAMEVNPATTTILSKVTFRDAIWLFPPAFALHVLEEWPRFTSSWAKRHRGRESNRFP